MLRTPLAIVVALQPPSSCPHLAQGLFFWATLMLMPVLHCAEVLADEAEEIRDLGKHNVRADHTGL